MQFWTTDSCCSKLGKACCAGFWSGRRKKSLWGHISRSTLFLLVFVCFCICVLCTRSKVVKSETKKKPHCLLGPNDVDSVVPLGSEGKVILNSTYVYYGQNVNFFSSTRADCSNAKACCWSLQLFSSLDPFRALHKVLRTFTNLYKCCVNAQVLWYREKGAAINVHKFLFHS